MLQGLPALQPQVPPWLGALQAQRQKESDLERNNGVYYQAQLVAVLMPESVALDKGIRRAKDKVGAQRTLAPASLACGWFLQEFWIPGTMYDLTTCAAQIVQCCTCSRPPDFPKPLGMGVVRLMVSSQSLLVQSA